MKNKEELTLVWKGKIYTIDDLSRKFKIYRTTAAKIVGRIKEGKCKESDLFQCSFGRRIYMDKWGNAFAANNIVKLVGISKSTATQRINSAIQARDYLKTNNKLLREVQKQHISNTKEITGKKKIWVKMGKEKEPRISLEKLQIPSEALKKEEEYRKKELIF